MANAWRAECDAANAESRDPEPPSGSARGHRGSWRVGKSEFFRDGTSRFYPVGIRARWCTWSFKVCWSGTEEQIWFLMPSIGLDYTVSNGEWSRCPLEASDGET